MNWFKSFWRAFTEPQAPRQTSNDRISGAEVKVEGVGESEANFTPRAQQVFALARQEAERLHHNFVGTEHLLLGLIRLGQGTAVAVLRKRGIDLENARKEVERQVASGADQKICGRIPFTPRVKKALALASKEARALNHTYVGTEHILLGLLREGDGVAAWVLKSLGLDTETTRLEVLQELDPNASSREAAAQQYSKTAPVSSSGESIDTSEPYDIYCEEGSQVVIYRNARFKGVGGFRTGSISDRFEQFYELELAGGQTLFIRRQCVLKFCKPGADVRPGSVDQNPS